MATETQVADFGTILQQFRENKGWSRRELSLRIKRTEASIHMIETGRTQLPIEPKLKAWLKILGCTNDKINELIKLSRNFQLSHNIKLKPREPANPDIVRLIQVYKYGTLSEYDRAILKTICREKG